uniref:Uncharacterized protein n=1 Tax=Timema genevievae TaxID=629358 RepID=A0A7R9JZS0_TIMGE|nr:unnamed protein product [Timema genevievae]
MDFDSQQIQNLRGEVEKALKMIYKYQRDLWARNITQSDQNTSADCFTLSVYPRHAVVTPARSKKCAVDIRLWGNPDSSQPSERELVLRDLIQWNHVALREIQSKEENSPYCEVKMFMTGVSTGL